jgi:hypothetical protein
MAKLERILKHSEYTDLYFEVEPSLVGPQPIEDAARILFGDDLITMRWLSHTVLHLSIADQDSQDYLRG